MQSASPSTDWPRWFKDRRGPLLHARAANGVWGNEVAYVVLPQPCANLKLVKSDG